MSDWGVMKVNALSYDRAGVALPRRRRTYRLAVGTLIALTGIWRLVAMVQWSWWIDDWSFIQRAHDAPFLDYITQIYNDHLQPGQMAILWVITRLDPLNFSLSIVAVWTLSMISLVVWALLFRSLFGERWAAVVGLIPIAMAPGFVPIVVWTAAGLTTYVLQLFMGLTMLLALRWIRDRSRRSLALTVGSFVLGLFFWEKGLLTVIPVLGLGLLLCRTAAGSIDWRRLRTLVLSLAVPAAIYVVIYLVAVRAHGSTSNSWVIRSLGDAAIFYWAALTQDLLPTLTGGPWPSTSQVPTGLLVPTTGAQWLAFSVGLAVVVWGLSRRRRGWVPVVTAAVYCVVRMGLLLVSSRYAYSGVFSAFDFRYAADTLAVFAVMGTLLLIPAVGEKGVLRHAEAGAAPRRLPAWVAPATGVAFLGVTLWTSSAVWDGFKVNSPKPYVDALMHDARAAGSSAVVDTFARPDVFSAYLAGDEARLSRMLAPLELPVRWDGSGPQMLTATAAGTLRPAVVGNSIRSLPGPVPSCGYLVKPGESQVVPMTGPAFEWGWGIEVGYFSAYGATLLVTADKTTVGLALPRGLGSVQGVLSDSVHAVRISSTPDSSPVCVDHVVIGLITPAPETP